VGLAMSYLRVPPTRQGEAEPALVARLLFGAPDWRRLHPQGCVYDVGGAWQALHYLLTGDPWDGRPPAADVVCGGRLLTEDGAEELGMDVIYLAPERVKMAADLLAGTAFETLAARLNPRAMAAAQVQDAQLITRDGLRRAYEGVGRFFGRAMTEGQAVYKVMA
jgi:uncharacterized protein DUF1877